MWEIKLVLKMEKFLSNYFVYCLLAINFIMTAVAPILKQVKFNVWDPKKTPIGIGEWREVNSLYVLKIVKKRVFATSKKRHLLKHLGLLKDPSTFHSFN